MPHDVFISYATEDKATADAVCAALGARGIKCWIASKDIMPSERYAGEIIEAIDASRVFILVFSSNSNRSLYVASEVGRAFSKEVRIISFRIEEVLPSNDLALFISDPQWLDAVTPPLEDHLTRLAETVKSLLANRPPPPPRVRRNPLPVIIIAGIVLVLSVFAVWFFNRPAETIGGGTPTPTPVTTPAVNYQQLYDRGVELLSDTSQSPHKRSEGVRLLGEVAASGDEKWYWQAMNRLTDHVKTNARWDEEADTPPRVMPQDVFRALEAITAQPPVYPAGADDKYKRQHRRDLKFTDLRGLRLVGGAHLEYADLKGANLDGAVLTGAQMEDAVLNNASLRGANLYGARMKGVVMDKADINAADLRQADRLSWFNAGGAYNWQCANLDDKLRDEIRAGLGPKASAVKCQ